MAYILRVPSRRFFLKNSTIGRQKAKVFPEPVRSLPIKSSLL